jgi:CRISPR-associated protein Cmr1
MPMPTQFVVRYRVVTPAFLGGADLHQAELRPPSIKAALRFWYRAVDPAFARRDGRGPVRESLLFGATEHGAGQSKVLLSLAGQDVKNMSSSIIKWDQFAEGNGRRVKNGLAYLGYPLRPRRDADDGEIRKALAPGSTFSIRLVVRPGGDDLHDHEVRGLVAAAWLLGHLGGLGSRSRRGFGSLAVEDWRAEGPAADALTNVMKKLPLGSTLKNLEAWTHAWSQVVVELRSWFGVFPTDAKQRLQNPNLGPLTRTNVVKTAFTAGEWPRAMNAAGRLLQDFRALRQPDYDLVKQHLLQVARAPGGKFLQAAPPRVTFGLPLTFRFGSLTTNPTDLTLVPYPSSSRDRSQSKERMGSLLFVRILTLRDGLHPAFFRLDGAVPGIDTPAGQRFSGGRPLGRPVSNALDDFMSSLERT